MGALKTLADAVHTELCDDSVKYGVGSEYITNHETTPFVAWAHETETHVGGSSHAGPQQSAPGELSKPCLTRRLNVDVHIWAESSDAAEDLLHAIIAASYNIAAGSVTFGGARWPKQEEHEHLEHGEPVILRVLFDVPVNAVTQKTATVATANQPTKDYVEEL